MTTSGTFILLGASNVTLGWPDFLTQLHYRWVNPVRLYTAFGMGRSYLKPQSGFMMWRLPGILHSGLWDALPGPADTNDPPRAIITDLGNDLVFGSTAQQVADAAAESVDRLLRWNQNVDIVLTRPPLHAVQKLSPARFRIIRSILFPGSQLNLQSAVAQTQELDRQIVDLAAARGVQLFQPQAAWYGMDPIHVKRPFRSEAFARMMDLWSQPAAFQKPPPRRLRAARPQPAQYTVWQRERCAQQPGLQVRNVSVYAY